MARKSKITYGVSKIGGVKSKSIGIAGPKGSYGINKNPFSTTYKAEGTTKGNVRISASVTKPKYGKSYYGIQVSKKF